MRDPNGGSTAALFHVRVAFQPRLVEVQQLPRFLERDLARADGALDVLAHAGGQLVGRVLHVVQHLADRVALDDGVEVDLAVLVEADVDRVGVAEEVVQVAEDLLVGAEQERAEVVGLAVERVQLQGVADVAEVDELVDLAVRVAGDVAEDGPPGRPLVRADGSA